MRLSDVTLADNVAAAHAGGAECLQCFSFAASRTAFLRNAAPSAGGLALTQVPSGYRWLRADLSLEC